MSERERIIDLEGPASTYSATVQCNNCDYKGPADIPKGKLLNEGLCPNCACQTIHKPEVAARMLNDLAGMMKRMQTQAPQPPTWGALMPAAADRNGDVFLRDAATAGAVLGPTTWGDSRILRGNTLVTPQQVTDAMAFSNQTAASLVASPPTPPAESNIAEIVGEDGHRLVRTDRSGWEARGLAAGPSAAAVATHNSILQSAGIPAHMLQPNLAVTQRSEAVMPPRGAELRDSLQALLNADRGAGGK